MASNWIKMRTDLLTHPKVVRMASALNSDRLRIVGGLWAVWGIFDVHSEDGELDGYTPAVVDEMLGFPGFADAMIAVGWLESSEEGLHVPRFDEHNGQSAKRRSEDTARKRKERTNPGQNSDENRTREDKSKKEKNPPTPQEGAWVKPDWIPADSWQSFEEMRRKRKKPLTDRARAMAVAKLEALRDGGNDPRKVIDQTVLHAWDTFYPLKTDDGSDGSVDEHGVPL